jgi:hypothetical protein
MVGSAALSGIATAVLTATLSDYVNFRNSTRALVQADYDKTKAVQLDIDNALQKFSDQATGRGSVTTADQEMLRKAVKSDYANSEQLALRLPVLKPEFDVLSDRLMALQKEALGFNGPEDAKEFVKAVAEYYTARDEFNDRAVAAQDRWLALN